MLINLLWSTFIIDIITILFTYAQYNANIKRFYNIYFMYAYTDIYIYINARKCDCILINFMSSIENSKHVYWKHSVLIYHLNHIPI